MGKKRDSYGSTKVKGAYDGSIRGIEDNKTIGVRVERGNVVEVITSLSEYLASGNENPVDITVFKDSLRLTVTARK